MINLLQLIKAFWRGFVGGPDSNRCITHRFLLNAQQLSIELPDSNVVATPISVDVGFPHTSTAWFEEHKRTYEQHNFVRVITKNWMYVPPIALVPSSEYGMLSCQLRIKQTNKINVLDKQALSQFVIQEYDEYHNGPSGKNTKIRQETIERYSKRATQWTPEEIEEEAMGWIENCGMPSIPPALIKTFNQTDWVFYQEVRSNRLSRHDFYCLPLSENSFLEVKFNHRVDRSDKHKKWARHALESQERIMASIYLDELPDATLIEGSDK
ncbi:hypothetical protein L3081_14370 [Colwellia sp. MSW7]|uniref:YqaJ viral recombinase domain-containing protein n=1 Tax=Colwellia maritima TaxID=2912588 RepID=A0ABS9X3H6_9GAMM|nr:hypothetical protein [Colwellia maritima]MCI2284352.1 hypothetical protein [Colwellia maritima]